MAGTGVISITPGVGDVLGLGTRICGVTVKIAGVREGMAVQTGKGCGATSHPPQAESSHIGKRKNRIFFITVASILFRVGRSFALQTYCIPSAPPGKDKFVF